MNGLSLLSSSTHRAGGGSDKLVVTAAALRSALARVDDDFRATAWQDGLDLLAVAAGLKRVCVIGRGARNQAWVAALRTVADHARLPMIEAAAWDPEPTDGQLPQWYLAATAQRRANRNALYIVCDEPTARNVGELATKGRVGAAEEAALLGYPPCCVAEQHARTLALEDLVAEMTERVAQSDAGRMMRMIEAGAAPLPVTRQDWDRYSAATAITPAAGTSVNMCSACAANDDSPAHALSRRYRTLSALAQYPLF